MALRPVFLFAFSLIFSSTVSAASLWELTDAADNSSAVSLPGNVIEISPMTVVAGQLAGLQEGSVFTLPFSNGSTAEFTVVSVTSFPNGDLGLRAVMNDAPEGGNYILSLTVGATDLLATVYLPDGKYLVQARNSGDQFAGFLYRESTSLQVLPPDLPALVTETRVDALNNSDVSIQQTLSDDYVTIGQTLDVTVQVVNNSGSAISGQTLKVIFILDKNEFLDATAGCTPKSIQYSNGLYKELHCPVNNLAAGATLTIQYSARITAAARPYTSSTVILDQARDDEFVTPVYDTLTDSDNDGISDYNEGLLGTNINNSSSGPSEGANATTDILLLYTPKYVSDLAGANVFTNLNQLIQQTNDIYATSGTGIIFRPVMYRQIQHTVTNGLDSTFDALQDRTGAFAEVDHYRAVSGADLVVLVDGRLSGGNSCGIAESSGTNTRGDFSVERGVVTVVFMPGPNQQQTAQCAVDTLAHELGHLHGLVHSRVEGTDGTFPWALGHGVNGSFHTIMAYSTHFPNSESLPVFSNPGSNACKGQPCGVSKDNASNGADAVLALRTTRFQVARYYSPRPAVTLANAAGGSTSATASAGVIRTGGAGGADRSFGSSYDDKDVLNLYATINVDPAHVGQTGVTHIVIAADGLGYFQVNSSGAYVSWDGNPANLVGTIAPRPLQAVEQLTAFRDLSFNSIGIPNVNLTVFFAYSIQGTSTLVYTNAGVPLSIH